MSTFSDSPMFCLSNIFDCLVTVLQDRHSLDFAWMLGRSSSPGPAGAYLADPTPGGSPRSQANSTYPAHTKICLAGTFGRLVRVEKP